MFQKIKEQLTDSHLDLLKRGKIVIGVSGGPDSVYLLLFLKHLNCKQVVVCCVNYSMRKQSKLEYEYVKRLTNELGYVFKGKENVGKLQNNIQEKAREIRYQFFYEILVKRNWNLLLIASTLNDLVESFYMNIITNKETPLFKMETSIKVNGIKIKLLRPLYYLTKTEILNDLMANNKKFYIDESNEKDIYLRNRIRKKIKHPEIFPKILQLVLSCEILENWLKEQSLNSYKVFENSGFKLDVFMKNEEIIKHEMLRLFLKNHLEGGINLRNLGGRIRGLTTYLSNPHSKGYFRVGEDTFIYKDKETVKILRKNKNFVTRK